MFALIVTGVVGIVLIVIGITNIKGNINSIHSYHRHRVLEKDKPIFGKLMGTGTIVCGIGIILSDLVSLIGELTKQSMLVIISPYITVLGLVVGIGIMVYAIIKYNKGIF